MVKILAVIFVVAAASLAAVPSAQAREGCGLGWHRGLFNGCVRNAVGPVVVAPRGAVVVAPAGRVCPWGWHLGPYGHCRRD